MRNLFLLAVAVLILSGCAGTTHVGTIGPIDFYSVCDPNALAPSYTALVGHQKGTKVQIIRVYGQRGWFPELFGATLDAAGEVGASALRWHGYKPDEHYENVTVDNGSGSSSNASQAQAQNQQQEQKQKQKQKQKAKATSSSSGGGGGNGGNNDNGNNGIGNGEDPQPPGDPQQND